MRSSAISSHGADLRAVALIFYLFAIPGTAFFASSPADARMRIETGRDLRDACAVLVEHALNPEPPTPRLARYCRQYLAGYFESLRVLHDNHGGEGIYGPSGDDPYACLNLDGPRSFDQLAARVVRTSEWHPDLLDGDALALARKAFADRPPC